MKRKRIFAALLSSLIFTSEAFAMDPNSDKRKIGIDEEKSSYTITPWKVEGNVDYDDVLRQFGAEPLTQDLINRW